MMIGLTQQTRGRLPRGIDMTRFRTLTMALVILLGAAPTAAAGPESKRPLREAESGNGRFRLEVDAGRPGRADRVCKGTLTERSADGRSVKRWERPLVNDAAPVKALVRDDGRFVVTLDEFRRGGARNALVIYGERGQLLRHFLLTDLLGKSDWRNVRASKRSVEWLEGSRCSFVAEPEQFLIELKWGREIRIDLKTLRLVNRPREAGADEEVPAEILAQLSDEGGGAPDEEELRRLAEQLGAQPEEIAKLLESGELDPATLEAALANIEEQRKLHAEELMLRQVLEQAGVELENAPDDQTRAAIRGKIEEIAARLAAVEAQRAALGDDAVLSTPGPMDDSAPPDEVRAAAGGISVPAPNPAEKVDYVAWLNRVTRIEGPSAVEPFTNAVQKFTPFAGDSELFDAAMKGDPAAFNAPEFQGWLDGNQEALRSFRAGAHLPFAGFPALSQGGDMIGILLPNLAPLRGLSRVAVAESRRQIANGDPHGAIGTLADTLAAGANTGNGPTLIENLVGVAMQALASRELMDVMASHGGELNFAQVAFAVESAYRPVRPLDESVQFERAMFMDTIQRMFTVDPVSGKFEPDVQKIRELQGLAAGGETDPVDNVMQTMGLATIDYDATLAEANRMYDRMAAAARRPFGEARGEFLAMERELEQTSNPMLKMLTPAFSRAHLVKTRAEAQRRASILLANIKAYEQQTGAPPESLDVFAGRDYAQDPFTGQPYIYRRTADGFVLYSAGANGTDDGGVDDPKAETNDAVYWPRPAQE
jgi:hypothetical protein